MLSLSFYTIDRMSHLIRGAGGGLIIAFRARLDTIVLYGINDVSGTDQIDKLVFYMTHDAGLTFCQYVGTSHRMNLTHLGMRKRYS
jgi:hypothetical protein